MSAIMCSKMSEANLTLARKNYLPTLILTQTGAFTKFPKILPICLREPLTRHQHLEPIQYILIELPLVDKFPSLLGNKIGSCRLTMCGHLVSPLGALYSL